MTHTLRCIKALAEVPLAFFISPNSHFDLVSSLVTLEATELVLSEPVTQMALELINNHLI